MEEQFQLQWNDFDASIRANWEDLRKDSDFSDIYISSEDGRIFGAHKLVLSASSQYFKGVLQLYKESKPLIHLRSIQTHLLEKILDFIYLGKASVYQSHLEDFMCVATDLKIKGLCKNQVITSNKEQVHAQNINKSKLTEEVSQYLPSPPHKPDVSHMTDLNVIAVPEK